MSKTVNYTPEQAAALVKAYEAIGDDVTAEAFAARQEVIDEYAARYNKKNRSIISKLVNEGVYIRKPKASKVTGGEAEKKNALAVRVVEAFGDVEMPDGHTMRLSAASLEKTSKVNLAILLQFTNERIMEDMPETEH